MMYFRADSPIKSLGDIIQAKEPPKCGSSGTTSTAYTTSKLLNEAFKAKTISISGYQGGSEIDLAVERGELVCRQMDVPPHFGREPFDGWHKRGFDRHIFQGGPKRDARLAEVPTLFELLDQYKSPAIMRSLTRVDSGRRRNGPADDGGAGGSRRSGSTRCAKLMAERCATRA